MAKSDSSQERLTNPAREGAADIDFPDFENRILMIVLNVPGDTHLLMEQVRLEVQGGRLCLVGSVPKDSEFLDHIPMTVAWENVSHYFVFDRHQFATVYKEWTASLRRKPSIMERLFGKS